MKPLVLLAALTLGGISQTAMANTHTFYIGTYTGPQSKGIYKGTLDSQTGKLGPLELVGEAKNPSFLALSPDGKYLYAAIEDNTGAVGAWKLNDTGAATFLNQQSSGGNGACHVWVDATGKTVLVANYGSGDIAALPVKEDGSLGERTAYIKHTGSGPDKGRQKEPHAHAIYTSPDNKFVYACDLGTDEINIYKLDAEKSTLTPNEPRAGKVPPGGGPRHLEFVGNRVYVCNEMKMSVTAFERDAQSGGLTEIQTVSSLPPNTDIKGMSTAEIFAHPSGKTLYLSNRGHDSIAVFDIAEDGKLTLVQNAPSPKMPRGFDLSPDGKWLVVGGQSDNTIRVLKIEDDGKLTATENKVEVGSPVSILFAGRRLFDGQTLAGWEGDTQKTWRVEGGAITAGAPDKHQQNNDFLATTQEYDDFDLRFKMKLTGTEGFINSGVQFRSRRVPNHFEVSGYQADFGAGYYGALYDESRRNKILMAPAKEIADKAVRPNDWNDYRIRAIGPHIQLWLNGIKTVDYIEADKAIPQKGIIALQIHGGAKAQVQFKDIVIEEIPN
jgi:6-phosphogluconolactonase